MMIRNICLLLASTACGQAFAAETIQCEFSDGILTYRDEFTFPAHGKAAYTFYISSTGEREFEKVCWSKDVSVREQEGTLQLEGELECVDTEKGNARFTFDPVKMTLSGSWRSEYPCRRI